MPRRNLPKFTKKNDKRLDISNFSGLNNTDHPTILKDNVPINILNSFHRNGILEKRGGTVREGDYLTAKHTEEFTATTKRDAVTTGDWATDGTANLLTNTTTPDTMTSGAYANGYSKDRHNCVSSNGTIFISYQTGAGILARKSTDKGATWTKLDGTAGETTIDSTTNSEWSIWLDESDHVHVALMSSSRMYYRKLTYSAGNWAIGSAVQVGSTWTYFRYPSIAVSSTGKIWITACFFVSSSNNHLYVYSSTNGTTFTNTDSNAFNSSTSGQTAETPTIIMNNDNPFIVYGVDHSPYGYYSINIASYDGSNWSFSMNLFSDLSSSISDFSVTKIADDNIWLIYRSTAGIKATNFNGTSLGSVSQLSSTAADGSASISLTTDGTNLWAIWGKYNTGTDFDMVYKKYNGTSWDVTATDIINDGVQNAIYSTPLTISGQTVLPIQYRTLNSAPYNIKVRAVQLSGIIQSIGYDSTSGSQTYSASVTSTGDTITTLYADSTDNNTFSDFGAISGLTGNRYIKFKSTITTTNLGTSPSIDKVEITYGGVTISGEHSFTRNDGNKYLLSIAGTGVYFKEASGNWLNIYSGLTTGLKTTGVAFGNYYLITNGTDTIKRFNGQTTTGTVSVTNGDATVTGVGTTWNTAGSNQLSAGGKIKIDGGDWYTIASITSDTSLELTVTTHPTKATKTYEAYAINTLGGTPPTGKYIVVHKGQVIVSGDSTNPSRIQWSDVEDATTWPPANIYNVDTNDGSVITGMAPYRDVLLIGKYDTSGTKKSIQGLFGTDISDFSVRPLTSDYGFVGQYSVATTPNGVMFLDRFGIIMTNLTNFQRIDLPIESTVDVWNQAYIQNAYATYFDERVFFAIPFTGSVTNNYLLEYDLKTKGWGIHTGINPSCFVIYSSSNTPELYFGDQTAVSAVFKWNSGTSDNGQAINWTVETKDLDMEEYFMKKRFKYLYAMFEATGAYDVTAYYALDGNTSYTQLDEVMTLDAGTDDVTKRWVLPGLSGSTIRFKLVDNSTNGATKLVKLSLSAIEKGMRTN